MPHVYVATQGTVADIYLLVFLRREKHLLQFQFCTWRVNNLSRVAKLVSDRSETKAVGFLGSHPSILCNGCCCSYCKNMLL